MSKYLSNWYKKNHSATLCHLVDILKNRTSRLLWLILKNWRLLESDRLLSKSILWVTLPWMHLRYHISTEDPPFSKNPELLHQHLTVIDDKKLSSVLMVVKFLVVRSPFFAAILNPTVALGLIFLLLLLLLLLHQIFIMVKFCFSYATTLMLETRLNKTVHFYAAGKG